MTSRISTAGSLFLLGAGMASGSSAANDFGTELVP